MAQLDKSKLVVLRNNIERYLQKEEEKANREHNTILDNVKKIREEIRITIEASKPDLNGLVKAIDKLVTSIVNHPIVVNPPNLSNLERILSELPKSLSNKEDKRFLESLKRIESLLSAKPEKIKDRTDDLIKVFKEIQIKVPEIEFPSTINIGNFPPQKVPQPVTNISINPLRGLIHTTAATVTTSLTALPTYGVLNNRRSIMIFNNDASATVYIGGSNVTVNNGLPVLAQSYSPSIDAGVRMVLYGIASQSINVRVIEISNEAIGG